MSVLITKKAPDFTAPAVLADNSIDEKNIIKMYYPYLYDNEIFNKTELINNKPFLF